MNNTDVQPPIESHATAFAGRNQSFAPRVFALQAVMLALVLSLSCLAALASLPRAQPGNSEPFILVFAPWISAQKAASLSLSAGFQVLRGGVWPFVVVVADPGVTRPSPASAFLALKLDGLAGCLDNRPDTAT